MATNLGELYYSLRVKDLTQQDIDSINRKLQSLGSNIRIDPQAFRQAVQNAANGAPVNIAIGGVKNLKDTLDTASASLKGILVKVDDNSLTSEINRILANNPNIAKAAIGVNDSFIRDSIKNALQGHKFTVDIQVLQNQARQAVQNALNGVGPINRADVWKYEHLKRGENQAALAELNRLRAAQLQAAGAATTHARASVNLSDSLRGNIRIAGELGAAFASLYSIHAAKQFLANVIEIGGELEHQKIALDTIYGDPGKTETLFAQIKGLARSSPFGVMDLTKNIKQLSAYGVAYNEVYDTAKRLADISAATSVDINRLILAFGKTKNRTFLDGLEAKQFAYANIPIYDALSKKLTELEGKFVSVRDVMGRIKKREIGFDMVKEILWDMTDEGGKFYNMQERLAGSVKTSWKLVRDNIELMFGEIAEGGVGSTLKSLGEFLQGLTREWRTLFTVLAAGVGVWGIHRLSALGLSKAVDATTASTYKNLVASKQKEIEDLRAASITRQLTADELAKVASSKKLTAAELQQAMANNTLTKEQLKRLYISGQINKATLQQLVGIQALTMQEYKAIAGTNAWTGAWIKFKAGLSGLKSIGASIFSSIVNPMTAAIAAVGGIAYLWQKNSREDDIADEVGKGFRERGEGMAKSIKGALEKPFENLSAPETQTLVEEYKNLIKDYATLPEDTITRAITDDKGKIRNTADQIIYLRKELESLMETANSMEKDGGKLGTIISATGDGILKEDVVTNMKDWEESYKATEAAVIKLVTSNKDVAKEIVKTAAAASPAFAKEIENVKNLNEQLSILAHNRDEYAGVWDVIDRKVGYFATRGGSFWESFPAWNTTLASRSKSEIANRNQALEDLEYQARMFKEYLGESFNPKDERIAEMVRQSFRDSLNKAGVTVPELKQKAAQIWQQILGVEKIMPDDAEQKWKEEIEKVLAKVADQSTREALKTMMMVGYDNLPKNMQDLVKKSFTEAEKQAIEQSPELHQQIQNWWDKNSVDVKINMVVGQKGEGLSQTVQDILNSKGGPGKFSFSTLELLNELDEDGIDPYKLRNALQKKRQDAKNEMDAAIKGGWSKDSETYKKIKENYDVIEKAIRELGWEDLQLKDQKSNKHDSKDTIAEDFKRRFKDLKDAWAEYKKWEKSVGDEAAAETVAGSGLFGDMDLGKIPRTVEQYQKAIEDIKNALKAEMEKPGGSTTQRESLLNEILKTLLDVKKTVVDEQIEKALATVDEEIERKLEDWNLYERIRKATGNHKLASVFSFGIDDVDFDFIQLTKDNFNKQLDAIRDTLEGEAAVLDFDNINIDNAHLLPDELRKAWEQAVKAIDGYRLEQRQFVADLLSEYQNTLQQIDRINADTDEKILKLWNDPGLNEEQKKNLQMKIEVKADYEKFQLSNDYLQFFGGVLAMTREKAEEVGASIRQHLDEQLQSGTISAKEYYDEIEKIDEQLSKIRNVKSNAVTFLTEGITGLNNKKAEENDAKRLMLAQEIKMNEERAAKAREEGKRNEELAAKAREEGKRDEELAAKAREKGNREAARMYEQAAEAARSELKIYDKIAKIIVKNQEGWEKVAAVTGVVSNVVNGIGEAFGTIKEMAASLGADVESGEWLDIEGILDTFQAVSDGVNKIVESLMSGDIGGSISGAASLLLTPITIWAQIHDKKLQKDIEASERMFDRYQNLIDQIEGKFKYFLGNRRNLEIDISSDRNKLELAQRMLNGGLTDYGMKTLGSYYREMEGMYQKRVDAYETGGALGYERQLMIEQLEELERQRSDYEQMKGDHKDDIEEVTQQIEEQKQAIKDFAEEMANITYGIDLSGWASQIGDALVDAFSKGEDAAEAFKNTVNDIMRDVVSNVITQDIIAPAMKDMQDWLFGKDGQGGAYGEDFWLDESNVAEMYSWLGSIEDAAERALEFMENVNEMTGGKLKDNGSEESAVRTGIQSITEDTADLLASYVNSIRAYVAQDSVRIGTLIDEAFPKFNAIAESQLQQLVMITENTRRNMEAAEAMKYTLASVETILGNVTKGTARFFVK